MPYKCTACDKSFRYKVSQRTHKCPAQPPGMVVRQTGDLLQKLLQNSSQNSLLIPEPEELDQKQNISIPDEISLDDLLQVIYLSIPLPLSFPLPLPMPILYSV